MLLNENIFYLLSKKRSAIMGIAAISIIIFHCTFYQLFEEGTTLWLIEKFVRKNGNLGVDIFFLLSGFGLLYSIEKNSIKKFYYNRFKKIIIPYTFSVIILAYENKTPIIEVLKGYIGYSFIFENINATPWFIPAIVISYLLFPIYYKFFSKSKNKTIFTIFSLIIVVILMELSRGVIRGELFGYFTRIPSFIIGVLFGYYSKYGYTKKEKLKKINLIIIIISTILLFVGLFLLYLDDCDDILMPLYLSKYYVPAIIISTASSLVYTFVFSINNELFKKINGLFMFVGRYSLELYCLENFSKSFIYMICPYINNVLIKDIVIFIECLAIAYIFNIISNIIIKKIETVINV